MKPGNEGRGLAKGTQELDWHDLLVELIEMIRLHWGGLASVAGVGLTVYFSWGARNAARLAERAANEARARLIAIDYYAEIKQLIHLSDELHRFLEQPDWNLVSDRASNLRYRTAVISKADDLPVSQIVRDRLVRTPTIFKGNFPPIDTSAASCIARYDFPSPGSPSTGSCRLHPAPWGLREHPQMRPDQPVRTARDIEHAKGPLRLGPLLRPVLYAQVWKFALGWGVEPLLGHAPAGAAHPGIPWSC